jgi:hypothetical protein
MIFYFMDRAHLLILEILNFIGKYQHKKELVLACLLCGRITSATPLMSIGVHMVAVGMMTQYESSLSSCCCCCWTWVVRMFVPEKLIK